MKKVLFASPLSIIGFLLLGIFSGILLIVAFTYEGTSSIIKVSFTIIWILEFLVILYNCFGRRVEIGEQGVRFTSFHNHFYLDWEEIKEIGITNYAPYSSSSSYPFLYFSKRTDNSLLISKIQINNEFIMIRYRRSLLSLVKKYWSGDIINL